MKDIIKYLDRCEINSIFWIVDGKGMGNRDIYHKFEILEIKEFHLPNKNTLDLTFYVSRIFKLYNKKHGMINIISNYHNGRSDAENDLLTSNNYNLLLKNICNNDDDKFFNILSESEFEIINQKEKNKQIKEYYNYVKNLDNNALFDIDNIKYFLTTIS